MKYYSSVMLVGLFAWTFAGHMGHGAAVSAPVYRPRVLGQ